MLHYIKTTLRLLLILLPCQVFPQTRFYVNNAPTPPGDGLSWSQAFHNLQSAIQLAQSGDEIWVAQGTYLPTTGTDRTISFEPKSGVKIYGGFAGTETQLSERNWIQNPTILSGDINIPGDSTDNSLNVMYLFEPDSNTIVDGFIIQDGNASNGGGQNFSSQRQFCGGGIYIMGNNAEAYVKIQHCTFLKNTAQANGGGIMINCIGPLSVNGVMIKDCLFDQNRALFYGGGVYRSGGGVINRGANIDHCRFVANKAFVGGGVSWLDNKGLDTISLQYCIFDKNIASNWGGGVYFAPERNTFTQLIVDSCQFTGNFAKSGAALDIFPINGDNYFGDVICSRLYFSKNVSPLNINPNIFRINILGTGNNKIIIDKLFTSDNTYYSQFAEISVPYAKQIITNSTIEEKNGLLLGDSSDGIIDKCTFNLDSLSKNCISSGVEILRIKNSRFISKSILNSNFNLIVSSVTDSILIDNSQININENLLIFDGNTKVYLTNCVVKGNNKPTLISKHVLKNCYTSSIDCTNPPSGITCVNCLSGINPLFINPNSNDYHLQPCSPLINAGTNAVISPGETDLDGLPRIQGGSVDIGPYESAPLSLSAIPQVTGACAQTNAGSVTLATSAACEPVQYHWSGPNGTSGNGLDQLLPGDYQLTITDAKHDTLLLHFTVPQNPQPVITAQTTPVFCGTTMAGTASLTAGNSQPPYQFDWGNGVTDAFRTGLIFGAYPVTVTDGNGCTNQSTIQINRMGNLDVQINELPISCYGASDGGITVQPDNGAAPFQWVWEWNNSTEAGITGLSAGIYNGTITDAFGCAVNWVVPLDNPDSISIIADAISATGPAIADGAIHLQPQGGTGIFTATWDNGVSGLDIDHLLPGFYTATVTDSHGCTQTTTVEVKWSVGTASPGQEKPVNVWPNPAAEWLYVQSPSGQYQFQILDAQGRIMRTADQGDSSVWIGDLPAGVYAWQLIGLDRVWSGVWVKGGE